MKFAPIARHRGIFQTERMCEALSVSRASFYEWLNRPESCRARENRTLLSTIRNSFEQSDRTYGSPRVWRDLQAWGHRCGENGVARLMLSAGLKARRKRRHPPADVSVRAEHAIAANLLDRHSRRMWAGR
jgi:putative transposase